MPNSEIQAVNFSMKVVLNKEKTKVLLAEVDNDFVDVLLSFLTLPLGTIVRLLEYQFPAHAPPTSIGSLNTLYQGLLELDSSYFCSDTGKHILVIARNPLAFLCKKLKLNLDDCKPTRYFTCRNWCSDNIYMNRFDLKCRCGRFLNSQIFLKSSDIQTGCRGNGVFTNEKANFLITDDLQVIPNSIGSCIQILNSLGFKDADGLEQITLTVGFNDIMELLKCTLFSRTPLSDLILHDSQTAPLNNIMSRLPKTEEVATSNKITVTAIVRKSTNKVLLIQADQDFVNFLFGLLVIPLGKVVHLLGTNTSLGSVDNLYRSIMNLDGGKHLKSEDLKGILLEPELPPEYFCKNQILPLTEDMKHLLPYLNTPANFKDLNGELSLVKGPKLFMVTNDLVVTPLSTFSSLSILNSLKIPLSDVEELEIEIGMQEALNILKASLTSTSALSDGINLILKKQVKQEK